MRINNILSVVYHDRFSRNISLYIILYFLSLAQSFKSRQSRRPSFTESIVSALNRFDFLDEDESTTPSTPPPPRNYEPPACHILPKQWQRVHRALFHHLCVVFDLVELLEKQLGPLDSMHNKSRDLIGEHVADVEKLMALASNPDDILLLNGEYSFA